MRVFRWLALILIVSLCAPVSAENNRRDGNFWLSLDAPAKLAYLVGFYDGMLLGKDFSYLGLEKAAIAEVGTQTVTSFNNMMAKYMANVTTRQLADGLDAVYNSDFRNRKILINNAVWLVANQIAGTPKANVDQMIETFRRNAQ
jgi:hypothetical protein